MAATNNNGIQHYFYDHTGQRVLKGRMGNTSTSIDAGLSSGNLALDAYTVYVNPFFTVTNFDDYSEATKHYYHNAHRVASSVITYQYQPISFEGGQRREGLEPMQSNSNGTVNTVYWILDQLSHHYDTEVDWVSFFAPVQLEHQFPLDFYFDGLEDCEEDPQCLCERQQYHAFTQLEINCRQMDISYWYHPDYLGSVEWVTKTDGSPHEFFWRDPWGHTLQYDNTSPQSSFRSMYGFTGHIEDGETGLIYAGARYYEPRVSVWLSVDPLAHEFPSWTPYHYVHNNPVNLVDPDGRSAISLDDGWYVNSKGEVIGKDNIEDDRIYFVYNNDESIVRNSNFEGVDQSELNNPIELPNLKERSFLFELFELGASDQTREYGSLVYRFNDSKSSFGYIFKSVTTFGSFSQGRHGSLNWNTAKAINKIGDSWLGEEAELTIMAHTHNLDNSKRLPPTLGADKLSGGATIGVVFDYYNGGNAYIFDNSTRLRGEARMKASVFFQPFTTPNGKKL
jgi:RHS repeat-associated protein